MTTILRCRHVAPPTGETVRYVLAAARQTKAPDEPFAVALENGLAVVYEGRAGFGCLACASRFFLGEVIEDDTRIPTGESL